LNPLRRSAGGSQDAQERSYSSRSWSHPAPGVPVSGPAIAGSCFLSLLRPSGPGRPPGLEPPPAFRRGFPGCPRTLLFVAFLVASCSGRTR
jgi:hypothetical protein